MQGDKCVRPACCRPVPRGGGRAAGALWRWQGVGGVGGDAQERRAVPLAGGGGARGRPAGAEHGAFRREPSRCVGPRVSRGGCGGPLAGSGGHFLRIPLSLAVGSGDLESVVQARAAGRWALGPGWCGGDQSWAGLEVRTKGADAQGCRRREPRAAGQPPQPWPSEGT